MNAPDATPSRAPACGDHSAGATRPADGGTLAPLTPAEAARISATYGVKVPEGTRITRHGQGEGVLWQDRHPREVAKSNWRAMLRRNRVARAPNWRPE